MSVALAHSVEGGMGFLDKLTATIARNSSTRDIQRVILYTLVRYVETKQGDVEK